MSSSKRLTIDPDSELLQYGSDIKLKQSNVSKIDSASNKFKKCGSKDALHHESNHFSDTKSTINYDSNQKTPKQ